MSGLKLFYQVGILDALGPEEERLSFRRRSSTLVLRSDGRIGTGFLSYVVGRSRWTRRWRLVFRLACCRRHDPTIDFVLFDEGGDNLIASQICVEFAIRNRANRQLIEEVLPTPENQQPTKEIGDGPTPPRFTLVYFSR